MTNTNETAIQEAQTILDNMTRTRDAYCAKQQEGRPVGGEFDLDAVDLNVTEEEFFANEVGRALDMAVRLALVNLNRAKYGTDTAPLSVQLARQ